MPTPYLTKLAKKHHKSVAEMEHLWDKAKDAAAKQGKSKDYAYITGILQHMIGEKSSSVMPKLQMTDDLEASMITHTMYCSALDTLLLPDGTELSWSIPGPLGHLLDHLKEILHELVDGLKIGIADVVKALKNRSIFQLLKSIGFNLKVLFKAIVKLAHTGPHIITKTFEDIEKGGWLEKLKSGAATIDDFLHQHPLLTKLGGAGIAALLLCMWMNTMFIGSPKQDLDMSAIGSALMGHYDVQDLFISPEGLTDISLFLLTVSGAASLAHIANAVNWLSSDMANLVLGLVYTGGVGAAESELVKKIKPFLFKSPHALEGTVEARTLAILDRLRY